MTILKEKLITIKMSKEAQLSSMKGNEGEISYSILDEEIKDVEYALEALDVTDEIERISMLNTIYSSTTSGSIYDAIGEFKKEL